MNTILETSTWQLFFNGDLYDGVIEVPIFFLGENQT